MTKDNSRKLDLRIYLVAFLVEGIISLIIFFLIPGDPKNAWVLGLSKSRLLILMFALLAIFVLSIQIIVLLRDNLKLEKLDQRLRKITGQGCHVTTAIVLSLTGLVGGIIFLINTVSTTDLFLKSYYVRLAPWMFWFTAISGQTLLILIFHDFNSFKQYILNHGRGLLAVLAILTSGLFIHGYLWDIQPEDWDKHKFFNFDNKFEIFEQDIYVVFNEGKNLLEGRNPYSRVHQLGSDLTWNFEIPTYFPIFYSLNWFTQKIGFRDFSYWLDLWKVPFLLTNLGVAYILFYIPYHRFNQLGFAALGALIWLFNRWTLHLTMIYHLDFIAIFFMVLSLAFWPRNKAAALLSFGISLGVKQIAIFMVPLYLIWIWQSHESRSWRKITSLSFMLVCVPLVFIMPFLLWDASGFVKSVLISATRNAESHFGIPSIDVLMLMSGLLAKIPMLALMEITNLLTWNRRINHYVASFLTMLIFVNFNSVLFRQYMAWVIPLIPMALSSTLIKRLEQQRGVNPI